MPVFSSAALRGDLLGGLVSSAVAIPLALGFGMFAFVTLGDEYFASGAVAGLVSALVVSLVSIALGDRSAMVFAPRVTTTFFLGSLLNGLLHPSGAPTPGVSEALAVFFSIIFVGGLIQALFGGLRLGTLIRFIPHPVMAGFQNMGAALLFLVQLGNVLGFDHNVGFTHVLGSLGSARPLSLAVAAATFAVTWRARKISENVPALLIGLGCGSAIYYALAGLGFGAALGPIVGVPTASVSPNTILAGLDGASVVALLTRSSTLILSSAFALAIVASIDALLCLRLASRPGDAALGGDRLLTRLGLANAVAAGFGGITTSINIGASVINRNYGGRSWISVGVNVAVLLAAVTMLFPLIAFLPRVVLSAVIMVAAVQHFDPWTKQLIVRLFKPDAPQRRAILLDLAVAMFVSIVSIAVNIVLAVFIGIGLAVLTFTVRMSRSNVRRMYRGDLARSRKARDAREIAVLEAKGGSILVVELHGALFFGSAERLARMIDKESAGHTTCVILGLRRVTEIDSTGLRILADIDAALARRGIRLALVQSEDAETAARLTGGADVGPRVFEDLDRAIEWAEDELLTEIATGPAMELALEQISLFRDFAGHEVAALSRRLARANWPAGHVVFRQGDPGACLYLVSRGRASVYLTAESGRVRLVTFAPGSVFGELAILDQGPRSATVIADEEMTAYSLSIADFADLRERDPAIAVKLLSALARELSNRLRRANMTIRQLEL